MSKPTKDETVVCAVRMDCIYGKHDDVIELPAPEAMAAEQAGFVDSHPNAIAAIREQKPTEQQTS
ncbi:MAG: hypothetical protein ACK5JE_08045 [Castellaniella sp.]|uniref:hypothetical protein n=1 Tax=Castellaniella sp. TaxID=1955812 RepID=UPI003A8B1E0E